MTSYKLLHIVIPVKNEADTIEQLAGYLKGILQTQDLKNQISITIVNDGSTDETENLLRKNFEHSMVNLKRNPISQGVFTTLHDESLNNQYKWTMLLPCDCCLPAHKIPNLLSSLESLNHEKSICLLYKQYLTPGHFLKIYSFLQNLSLCYLKTFAFWTNGFILRTEYLAGVSRGSIPFFAEDYFLFKKIKRELGKKTILLLPLSIHVSARKYEKDGVFKRSLYNVLILLLLILKYKNYSKLKKFYHSSSVFELF